ncbi:MAG: YceI family protein [Saprospiraceae bacterium]|nr:YceI family protein [Candidatus Vicinibacter affinis]MBP6172352.1 YceI family protein [Saprospiraceae bacterium]MBK6573821.1 YceI family protein [Candidatus Vicinibacter affinis]MBK7302769.1 YceI family protein [Candidatus Vicinibacter affinis]MBK7800234.1 YceI family protein [Candidatus Vicinibacter affinis]
MKSKLIYFLAFLSIGAFYWACTHDDDVNAPTGPKITRDSLIFLPGLTAGNANEWKFDKTHSSVLWQTKYVGAAGLLTGRFNQFGIHEVTDVKAVKYAVTTQPLPDTSWAFYENQPLKTYFNGYVQINTSNTGEPGRDAGCNVAGMGTVAIEAGTQNLSYPNLAKIKTKEVKFDPASNGYLVTIDLTYQGKLAAPLTKTITGKMSYVPKQRVQFGTAAAYDVFGLQLSFQFNCRDFGIVSTSVSDVIEIQCNANFNNK